MNAELAEIALVTPRRCPGPAILMRPHCARSARKCVTFAAPHASGCSNPLYGTCRQPGTAVGFGHNVYGMFDDSFVWSVFRQYLFYHWISPSPRSNCPCLSGPRPALSCWDQNGTAFPFNCGDERYQQIQEQGLAAGHGTWPMGACQTEDYLFIIRP